jgi:hypothetical protein
MSAPQAVASSPARTALQTVYDNLHGNGNASYTPLFEILAPRVAEDQGSVAVNPDEIECG